MTTLAWLKSQAEKAALRGWKEDASHFMRAAAALAVAEGEAVDVLLELADRATKCDACGAVTRVPALSCDPRLLRVEAENGHREVRFECHNCSHVVLLRFA